MINTGQISWGRGGAGVGFPPSCEMQHISLLLTKLVKELVVATSRTMDTFWIVRRHHLLFKLQLQGEDRVSLL